MKLKIIAASLAVGALVPAGPALAVTACETEFSSPMATHVFCGEVRDNAGTLTVVGKHSRRFEVGAKTTGAVVEHPSTAGRYGTMEVLPTTATAQSLRTNPWNGTVTVSFPPFRRADGTLAPEITLEKNSSMFPNACMPAQIYNSSIYLVISMTEKNIPPMEDSVRGTFTYEGSSGPDDIFTLVKVPEYIDAAYTAPFKNKELKGSDQFCRETVPVPGVSSETTQKNIRIRVVTKDRLTVLPSHSAATKARFPDFITVFPIIP